MKEERTRNWRLSLLIAVPGLVALAVTPSGAQTSRARQTSSPPVAPQQGRAHHSAVVAWGHQLVILGGDNGVTGESLSITQPSIAIADPLSQDMVPAGLLLTGRSYHHSLEINNGTILVMGGVDADFEPLASTEFIDSDMSVISGPALGVPRTVFASLVLPGGGVTVLGGHTEAGRRPTASVELLRDGERAWSDGGRLLHRRAGHTATLLDDGRVLIVGGYDGRWPVAEAELWDPDSGVSLAVGRMAVPRFNHRAVRLGDGSVAVFGGATEVDAFSEIEIWSAAIRGFQSAGQLIHPRVGHTATGLPDGRVLIVGGTLEPRPAELWTPSTRTSSAVADLVVGRSWHTASPVGEDVWIVGGIESGEYPFVPLVVQVPSP